MIQAFTPELCVLLSSLVPGFEGHYDYYKRNNGHIELHCEYDNFDQRGYEHICPAWQVEDVLRNIFKIAENFKEKGMWKDGKIIFIDEIVHEISCFIAFNSFDTAYQKIEEYLWSILT